MLDPPAGDPLRVLIVDDQRVFADSLKLILDTEPALAVVGIAGTAEEALDLAVKHDAQLVLMDIGLPTLDGFEATRRLLAIKKAARVVALTGRSESEVTDLARDAGMIGYLSKDKIHETVLPTIAEVIRSLTRSPARQPPEPDSETLD